MMNTQKIMMMATIMYLIKTPNDKTLRHNQNENEVVHVKFGTQMN